MRIDTVHISTFSARIIDGYSDLVQYPSMNDFNKNDWAEFDGLEVELSNPTLKKREIELSLLIIGKAFCKFFDRSFIQRMAFYRNFKNTKIEVYRIYIIQRM